MTKPIKDIIQNTKDIFMTDSSLETLMDFERVLDELDLYVFSNWKKGELVEGPLYEKYFISCTFMYPYNLMPDPSGGERLLSHDCEISYKKDYLETPVEVESPDDFVEGSKMPRMAKSKIWLVSITMPKSLLRDIKQGSLELEGSVIDMSDIDDAYEQGTDEDANLEVDNQNAEEV